MKKFATRLNLEVLEGRIAPSAVTSHHHTHVAPSGSHSRPTHHTSHDHHLPQGHHTPHHPHHHKSGPGTKHPKPAETPSGIYVCDLLDAETPTNFHFVGNGVVNGMGPVDVLADVDGVGFAGGMAAGQATFSNLHGSVTVQLTGPEQSVLSTLPTEYHYRVLSATGTFRSFNESGEIHLTRTADAVPVRYGFHFIETGTFQLTIQ